MFKTTKIALCVLLTAVLTYLLASAIGYLLSDVATSYKEVCQSPGLWVFMLIFGWTPGVITGNDYNDYLNKK